MKVYRGQIIQDGQVVAQVETYSVEDCVREINHYAMVHSQDGAVKINIKILKRKKKCKAK